MCQLLVINWPSDELFSLRVLLVGKPANIFVVSFRNENFMIRTVADVAITEVTIWQQCVITSRDKKEEKMKNT
jgi:hypothetical protein